MTSTNNYRIAAKQRGDRPCQVVLTKQADDTLTALCGYHRLSRREVVERLILGVPLSERTAGIGLCPAEVAAYEHLEGKTL